MWLLLSLVFSVQVFVESFYLPGIAPIDYQIGDQLEVKVGLGVLQNEACMFVIIPV